MLKNLKNYKMHSPTGLDKITDRIATSLKKGKLNHAYIISGENGIGKSTLLEYLVSLIMCESESSCGKCNICRMTSMGTNPDIISVSNDDKSVITIEKIRTLISELYIMPSVSKRKIFIVKNAHLLNQSAQNALLKAIEEPPEYAVFFLVCENINLLLPTVLSRCTIIKMHPLKREEVKSILGGDGDFLFEFCGGNIGKIKSLLYDEDFLSLRDEAFKKLMLLSQNDEYKIYDIISFFDAKKQEKNTLFDLTISFLRDALFYKMSLEEDISNKDKADMIKDFSKNISKRCCIKLIDTVTNTQKEMGEYGNYNLSVTAMLMKLWEEIHD